LKYTLAVLGMPLLFSLFFFVFGPVRISYEGGIIRNCEKN